MFGVVVYFKDKGIEVFGNLIMMIDGFFFGEIWVYFFVFWGMQLEFVSYLDGKVYEVDFDGCFWDLRL